MFLEKGAGWVSLDRGGKQAKGGVYQRGKERKSGKAQESRGGANSYRSVFGRR